MTSHAYRSSWPDRASAYNLGVSWAANDTGMVFAWIKHVPNQSLMFYVSILCHALLVYIVTYLEVTPDVVAKTNTMKILKIIIITLLESC